MPAMQSAFVLFKSNPKSSSSELAKFISRFPGFEEVWYTEGEYSFIARFEAPLESLPELKWKLEKHPGVLEVECLHAPVVLK